MKWAPVGTGHHYTQARHTVSASQAAGGSGPFEVIAYSHMEAPVGTHLFWTCLLRDCSFPGERRRLDEVANFIVENEFYNLQSLEGSDHPIEWAGSDKLSSEELS